MNLNEMSWEDFHRLNLLEKGPCLMEDGRAFHALIAQQFDRKQLDELGALATNIRFIAKSDAGMQFLQSLLSSKRAMLYFTQPSTRTFLSFCAACQILGISTGEVRDTATSSEFKGESKEDSVRTFSSYYDLIIMRTKMQGLSERMAWVLSNSDRPIPIINAGSGKDQHPTQALLDIYTLQRSFENEGGIDGKKIVFVGDLARGRTVRSLAYLLTNYDNVNQYFVAPEELQVGEDVLRMLREAGANCELSEDFKTIIPEADAIYMTRVQDEWDAEKGESAQIDISKYCFNAEHLSLLKPHAVIMHPFPRRNEISPDVDRDPRAVYWRQMRNGMWVRAALIASVFGVNKKINEHYEENL
ncbi:aspartate carbamoyltransferase [Verrucomicrobiota bacterium]